MKQLVAFLLFLPLMAAAQEVKTEKFKIEGKLSGLPDSVQVTLQHPGSATPLVQTYSRKESFVLEGQMPFAGPGRIMFSGKGLASGMDIFIDKGNTKIDGAIGNPNAAKITGTKEQQVFKGFLKVFLPGFKSLNDLNMQVNATYDPAKRNELAAKFNQVKDRISGQIDSFIAKNDESVVSAFLLHATKDLYSDQPEITAARLDRLTGNASVCIYKEVMQKEIDGLLIGTVGTMAMDFTQPDTAGIPVKLSAFRGKYVLLDFWASWCGPCRMENPNVVEAFNKFKAKNFTVLGVSLDRPGYKDAWIQAIKDDNLTWTHVSDLQFWQNQVAQMYRISSIPQNFLVDPTGKIIGKNLRGAALEAKLCEVLGCK